MYIYHKHFNGNPTFISAGIFINSIPWIHESRIIDSYEIICPIEGILPMIVDGYAYDVHPNEILIIPPNIPHKGSRYTSGNIKFQWLHFSMDKPEMIRNDQVLCLINDDGTESQLLLPIYTNKLFIDRFHVMLNQQLDLYQEHVSHHYLNAYMSCILYELSDQSIDLVKQQKIERTNLQQVQDWIRVHAFEDLSLDKITNYFKYNKNYLSRIYKQTFGIGITSQIIEFRLDKAKRLLIESDYNIEEIASITGFEDPKYFMRIFKKNENITPTQYRRAFDQRHFNNH